MVSTVVKVGEDATGLCEKKLDYCRLQGLSLVSVVMRPIASAHRGTGMQQSIGIGVQMK
jgi:hypothetical protein